MVFLSSRIDRQHECNVGQPTVKVAGKGHRGEGFWCRSVIGGDGHFAGGGVERDGVITILFNRKGTAIIVYILATVSLSDKEVIVCFEIASVFK